MLWIFWSSVSSEDQLIPVEVFFWENICEWKEAEGYEMVFTAIGHFMSVLHCTQEAYVCFYRNWLQMYESDSDWPRYVPTWVDASSQGIFDGKMLLGEGKEETREKWAVLSAVAEIKIRNFQDRVPFSCDADKTPTVRMKRLQKTIWESAKVDINVWFLLDHYLSLSFGEKLIQLGQTGWKLQKVKFQPRV